MRERLKWIEKRGRRGENAKSMKAPTLLVLAAGMGSRYGGLKQLDSVGPAGETILDYGVFDAIRAGFGRVVFVIRREFEADFREKIASKYKGLIAIDFVFQSLDALPEGYGVPAGREKPWGTGHAVWCAYAQIDGPFAVIGADDFFGADAFVQLAKFLRAVPSVPGPEAPFCMVGYALARTLSEHGSVSRGLCETRGDGMLQSITERTAITADQLGSAGLEPSSLVSMNCFGFTVELFPSLEAQLKAFLAERAGELKSEFYLPAVVSTMIAKGEASVRVLPTTGEWFGVTNREDKPKVMASLARLIAAGDYPERLFP